MSQLVKSIKGPECLDLTTLNFGKLTSESELCSKAPKHREEQIRPRNRDSTETANEGNSCHDMRYGCRALGGPISHRPPSCHQMATTLKS